ncbi:MAG: hypothetical protein ACE366_00070 [Bradymonadia bacterium]
MFTHLNRLGTACLKASAAVMLTGLMLSPAMAQQQGATTSELPREQLDLDSPHQFRYQTVTVFRLNPLGLINQSQLGYRYRLFNPEDKRPDAPLGQRVLQNTYAGISFAPSMSPAFARPGVLLELQPLALMRFSALYEQQFHYGGFDTIQSFGSPNAEFSDKDQDDAGAAGLNYSTSGRSLTLAALLQMKVGKIAARSNFRAQWTDMDTRRNDPVYYDIMFDVLQPAEGWMYTTDSDLLYYASDTFIVGLRHTWLTVDYPDDAFLPDENRDLSEKNVPMHRLGPIMVYRFNNVKGTAFNQPTLFVMANWWLRHRYRTGQEVSQAFPYVLIGYAFNGDL